MDRFWFLTWTTYGTWLPGDARGSVTTLRDSGNIPVPYNRVGTNSAPPRPGLAEYAAEQMASNSIRLTKEQAGCLLDQFHETARIRHWQLIASAVMSNHVHIVVGVPGDPPPKKIRGDFKAYGTRALNQRFEAREWWTESGSNRKLADEAAVIAARNYVRDQHAPLALFVAEWDELPGIGSIPKGPAG